MRPRIAPAARPALTPFRTLFSAKEKETTSNEETLRLDSTEEQRTLTLGEGSGRCESQEASQDVVGDAVFVSSQLRNETDERSVREADSG